MINLLTLDETAKLLHVSKETLRSLWRNEGLPVITVSRNRRLVSETALTAWLAGRTVKPWRGGSGAAGAATQSGAASIGASPSRLPRLASDDDGRSGSTGQRRPPCASSKRSSGGSVVAYRQRKAE